MPKAFPKSSKSVLTASVNCVGKFSFARRACLARIRASDSGSAIGAYRVTAASIRSANLAAVSELIVLLTLAGTSADQSSTVSSKRR